MDRKFAALADPTRCAVIELLRKRPRRASDLAQALAMSPPGLSRHLRVLKAEGFIADDAVEHDARVRMYRLEQKAFASLHDWLAAVEASWSEQLQAFKAHVEKPSGERRR